MSQRNPLGTLGLSLLLLWKCRQHILSTLLLFTSHITAYRNPENCSPL